jgi:flagellar FliL protein
MLSSFKNWTFAITFVTLNLFASTSAFANNDKASAKGAGAPVARLEPFIVNLASFDRYLQTTVSLQVSAEDISERVKMFMPAIRHAVIMILSSRESSTIQSAEGKKELIEDLRKKLNAVIGTKEDAGISDIFFENFVIQ